MFDLALGDNGGPSDVCPQLAPFGPRDPHSAQQKLPPDFARKAHFTSGKAEVQRGPGHSRCTQPQRSSGTAWPVFDLYWDVRWGGGPALVPAPCW